MRQVPTDIVQSFWLRFWREPRVGTSDQWRGTLWHEQQPPNEKPIAVNSEEEAFALVRCALQGASGTDGTELAPSQRVQDNQLIHVHSRKFFNSRAALLRSLWVRWRNRREV